ncbi:SH3 domain-containing protein [uncultured Amphritea sp.]|uniref:SH3 domain-containing protein n=1 Tax=uncultured Amphritea sp. TaxID=981605 RepID=UPI00261B68F7|nr:SH3 domain-containing protein [uncultured Amphritea sp.]
MTALRFFVTCLVLLSSALPQSLCAAERLEVEIRSTILNIREFRSTDSPVVGVVSEGDRLTVTTTDQRDWVRLDDGRGFISIHYVNVLSRTPVLLAPPEEAKVQTKTNAQALTTVRLEGADVTDNTSYLTTAIETELEPAEEPVPDQASTADESPALKSVDHSVDIESVSKTCRKNLHTLEYEFCQLLFKLKLPDNPDANLNADPGADQQLKITCSAQALATDKDKIQTLYELSNTRSVSRSVSNTSVIVEWSPATKSAETLHMALKAGQCRVDLATR